MHLWPSATIRDSFKLAYLRKLEWNLQRMKSEKESQNSVNQKLLDGQEGGAVGQPNSPQCDVNGKAAESTNSKARGGGGVVVGLCGEILMLLSCCFCCFCCGVFLVQLENNKNDILCLSLQDVLAQMKRLILSFDDKNLGLECQRQ